MSVVINNMELPTSCSQCEFCAGTYEGPICFFGVGLIDRPYEKRHKECPLSKLPSAQPEIIRCKDCKHWSNNSGDLKLRDNYCNEAMHGFYYQCSGDDFCSKAERRDEDNV